MNVDEIIPNHRGGRWRSTGFMSAVALCLRDWGFHDARLAEADDPGDLAGVPGVVLTARAPEELRLSTSLDAVTGAAAEHSPAAVGAAVLARRGRPADQAYVVLELRDFADLLAGLAGTPGAPVSARLRPRPVEP